MIGQEPCAYFENSRDFVDKHDYSIICYSIISADYTACSAHASHTFGQRARALEWFREMGPLVFLEAQIKSTCISHNSFCILNQRIIKQ